MTQSTLLSFKTAKIKIPDPSQDIKTNNSPTSQSQPSEINFKLNKNKNTHKSGHTSPSPPLSRTRWTEERWEEEYWKLTNKPPEEILKEAYELNDPGVLLLVDEIERGVKYDRRNPKYRDREQYVIHPGSWHILAQLVRILETKRKGGK